MAPTTPELMQWDSESKEASPATGAETAQFTFTATNLSDHDIAITRLVTTCGCTIAKLPPLPEKPFMVRSGASVPIQVFVDLRGKYGIIKKGILVMTSVGQKSLAVTVNLPPWVDPDSPETESKMTDRERNARLAVRNRETVFKGACASCHSDKAKGKMGAELFATACAICHDSQNRASAVPELKLRKTRDIGYWLNWISKGKDGTMMPGFASEYGGPLTRQQIASLVILLDASGPPKKS